jgi:predicted dehydrogenase
MKGLIVGAGFMGRTHLDSYSRQENAQIVAIVDHNMSNAQVLGTKYGCQAFPNLERALADCPVDFVDICLPSTLHKNSVIAALEKGCDVLVEKPFALTLDDIDAMIATSKSTGNRLMVAHVCRFMGHYIFLKNVVESGALGKPILFSAWRLSETPNWSWNNWLHDKQLSGGTVLDLSIHDIDIANWLFGTPVSRTFHESTSAAKPGSSHVVSTLTYADNVVAIIEASHLMPPGFPFTYGFRLVAQDGVLEWNTANTPENTLMEYKAGQARKIPIEELENTTFSNPYDEEIRHFLSCLESGEPFRISLDDAKLAVTGAGSDLIY